MSIFSRKKISTKGGDPVSTSENALFGAQFYNVSAGIPIRVDNAKDAIKNGYLKSDTVFTVINKISALGNGVKWQVYEVQDKAALKQMKQMQNKSANLLKYVNLHQKALKEVDLGVTLDDLLASPNSYQSLPTFWQSWCNYYLITGNTYNYGLRRVPNDEKSPIISMHIPNPVTVEMVLSSNFAKPIRGYKFAYWGREVADTEVWHTKMFNPDFEDGYRGLIGKSPIEVISNLVSVDVEGVSNQAAKFTNDGIRGILTGSGESAMMSQSVNGKDSAAVEKLKTEYYRQMTSKASGIGRVIKDILFYPLQLQWLKIGQTAQEMDTVSTLTEVKKRIYAAYNVPYQDDPKYSNANIWRKDAIISGLFPVLEQFKEMLNMFLLKSWESELGEGKYYIDFDMIASFPELQDDLASTITALNACEFISTDEKREAIYKEPLNTPQSKEVLVSFGKVPLSEVGAPDPDETTI